MSYPKDTKIALVKEYEQGKTVATISKDSGIPENSIYRWIREYHTINTKSGSFPFASERKSKEVTVQFTLPQLNAPGAYKERNKTPWSEAFSRP